MPSCPFCTPRTVHRLSLVALILAKEAISGDQDLEHYYGKLKSLGIPLSQLQPMVDWMRGALGDPGLLVTVTQMKDWSTTWDAIFYPSRRRQSLSQQQGNTDQLEQDPLDDRIEYADQEAEYQQEAPAVQHESAGDDDQYPQQFS